MRKCVVDALYPELRMLVDIMIVESCEEEMMGIEPSAEGAWWSGAKIGR